MKHIAIIGSGPAGCYLADHLLRLVPDASVDVIERLPVPFGLIRHGVAPDHQSTKAVSRLFDRVLSRDSVGFFGNVEVGRDVRLEELLSLYDAVVLATGAARDRRLGIPGEDLPGVVGSGAFVSWYNSHPDGPTPLVNGVRSAVVIGNGNVALDVARILAKGPDEVAGSDLSPSVTAWLSAHPLEAIHIVGRRGAAEGKFTDHELAELGTLLRANPVISDPASLAGDAAHVATLRRFAESAHPDAGIALTFHFGLTPVAFQGDDRLCAVEFLSSSGEKHVLPARLAVTCIGYEASACCTAEPENGVFPNENGRVRDRLYVVGWAKRGPSGTIPTNRAEAAQVAQIIAKELSDGGRQGGAGLQRLLLARQVTSVDYDGWRRIDAAELARAGEERCREKFNTIEDMMELANAGQLRPA